MEMDDIMTAQEEKFLRQKLNNLLNLSFKSVFSLFYIFYLKHAATFCDDLSGRVRDTGSYLVSNPTSPGWWRKGLKGKRFPFIKTEAFSEHLTKGFVGTPKLSVFQWE